MSLLAALAGCASPQPPLDLAFQERLAFQLAAVCSGRGKPVQGEPDYAQHRSSVSPPRAIELRKSAVCGVDDGGVTAQHRPDAAETVSAEPRMTSGQSDQARFEATAGNSALEVDARQLGHLGGERPPTTIILRYDAQRSAIRTSDQAALARLVSAAIGPQGGRVTIRAARGGGGTEFEQMRLAEARTRVVNQFLPDGIVESVVYDPSLPDDTVQLELARARRDQEPTK